MLKEEEALVNFIKGQTVVAENDTIVNQSFVSAGWKKTCYYMIKRTMDIILSVLGMVIAILPMVIISVLIMLESPGKAIYTQERVGKNGKPFRIYKFRSMYVNADEMMENFTEEEKKEWEQNFKLDNDPRITVIGNILRKSSLDELPQLLNILKGELSIVGPRPVVAKELEKYGENQEKFLSVTPGLTGYWQAYARSACSYEQRIEMELYYVEHASLWWDIRIIFATICAVLCGRGAK